MIQKFTEKQEEDRFMDNLGEYFILQKNDTGQVHIFRGKRAGKICSYEEIDSICGHMNKKDAVGNVPVTCLNAKQARDTCAGLGRKVCGTCVSNLYGDFKEEQ